MENRDNGYSDMQKDKISGGELQPGGMSALIRVLHLVM